ncbi:MAG TPA: DinB family protein [Gemmatimonadaceae bacterium]|nr:DinB family protein [Gemmatimonadaceae bacterium]
MHPRTAELFEYIDRQHESLKAAVGAVPELDLATRPHADAWSVAEVVEHLAVLEARLVPMFEKLIADARAAGLGTETDSSPILPEFDPTRFLNRARKIETGDATRPTGKVSAGEGMAALEQVRRELKRVLLGGDGLALGTIRRPHPAFGDLNLYEWLAFIGAHTGRHTLQVHEITDSLRGRATR